MSAKVALRSPFLLIGVLGAALTGFLVAVVGWNGSELHLLLLSHGPVLVASAVLIQVAIGLVPIRYLSLPGFFFITYAIQIFVPAALIALEPRRPAAEEYLLAVQMSLFLSSVGVVIASVIFYFHRKELRRYWKKPFTSLGQINQRQFYLLFFALALLIAGLWMLQVKTIPLFSLFGLRGESHTLAVLREESFKLLKTLPGMKYLYLWNRGMFFPLLIMIALGTYHQTRSRLWKRLFYLSLLVGLFYASLSLAKAPVANIVLMVGLYYYLAIEPKKWRWLLLFGAGLLVFPLLVYLFQYGRGLNLYGLVSSLRDLLVRLFYVPAEVLYYYFEAFPLPSGYLQGRSISHLAPLLGKPYFDTRNYIYLYRAASPLKTGHANAAFVGDLYADFGMSGVIFGSLLVGFTLQAAQVYVMTTAKSVTTVAVFVYLCYVSWILNSVSFPTVLLTYGFILALGILVVERVIRGSRSSGVAGPGEG